MRPSSGVGCRMRANETNVPVWAHAGHTSPCQSLTARQLRQSTAWLKGMIVTAGTSTYPGLRLRHRSPHTLSRLRNILM